MPVVPVPHDLRRAGTAAKRVHNHKAKWAYGGRAASCRPELSGPLTITRPAKPHVAHQPTSSSPPSIVHTRVIHHNSTTKINIRGDIDEALDETGPSDSSGVEDYDESVAMTFAEDLQGGDGAVHLYEASGQTLFHDMVTQAVEKFETKETEKLVKEYEIITRESETAIGYLADDDDFELVDRVQL